MTVAMPILTLGKLIERWDPAAKPLHCSNCIYARVVGTSAQPVVYCAAMIYLPKIPLSFMVRLSRKRSFIKEGHCDQFTVSDDNPAGTPDLKMPMCQ